MVIGIIIGFVVLIMIALFIGYVVNIYNQLVNLREQTEKTKQNIDVLLQQRQDELTKLIDTASEFMDQEESVLTKLTAAREQAEAAQNPSEQAAADEQVRQAMMEFDARTEAYPELTSQKNMQQVQDRISEIETQIADRRELYNESVTRHNTRIDQFPYVIFARQFNFTEKELFEAAEEKKEDVDVSAAFA